MHKHWLVGGNEVALCMHDFTVYVQKPSRSPSHYASLKQCNIDARLLSCSLAEEQNWSGLASCLATKDAASQVGFGLWSHSLMARRSTDCIDSMSCDTLSPHLNSLHIHSNLYLRNEAFPPNKSESDTLTPFTWTECLQHGLPQRRLAASCHPFTSRGQPETHGRRRLAP